MTTAHPDRALKPIDVPTTPLMAAFLSTELAARWGALQKDTGRKGGSRPNRVA